MTTIAYRNGILAVDRQGNWGDLIEETDMKMRLLTQKNTAITIAGDYVNGFHFMDWYEGFGEEKFVPKNPNTREAGFTAVVVRQVPGHKDFVVEYWNTHGYPIEIESSYDAWGAGAECALGAMYSGATAIDAVLAAGKHLCHTGFGCLYVNFNHKKLKISKMRNEHEF